MGKMSHVIIEQRTNPWNEKILSGCFLAIFGTLINVSSVYKVCK